MGWMMTGMGETYRYMGQEVPPRPPARVYPSMPSFTQQPNPSMPSLTQMPIPSMPIFTQPDPYTQAQPRPVLYSAQPDHAALSYVRLFHEATGGAVTLMLIGMVLRPQPNARALSTSFKQRSSFTYNFNIIEVMKGKS